MGQARKVEGKASAVEKTHVETNQKLKETLTQLIEVEKSWKSAEATLSNFEKQAVESLEAQKKAENKLALTVVELKQLKNSLWSRMLRWPRPSRRPSMRA